MCKFKGLFSVYFTSGWLIAVERLWEELHFRNLIQRDWVWDTPFTEGDLL